MRLRRLKACAPRPQRRATTHRSETQQSSSSPTPSAPVPAPKVTVHLKAVGNAPLLQKSRLNVSGDKPFAWLNSKVQKLYRAASSHSRARPAFRQRRSRRLGRRPEERLFLFVDAA